ncbi:serine/arginine repetitive matrix protein 1-like [Pezoporus flaviventris]|uniref:serine/arginine repetitive matrix protein 1-like n=1 Tax=Pezoporus flaviventris TaxID=889875 RepID=UPI002AB19AEA|nr:serine/arginine repetitive matrix protein 1-like [Pezoporus flaviventris]
MIAVSLKLVRKEREGLRTPTTSRPGRHLNSLRIAPPDSPPPARPRRRRSVRQGRAAATGCPPQPRHLLRRPTSPATAFLSSPRQRRGSARRTPGNGTTGQRSHSAPRRQPYPFRTRSQPDPPPQPSPAATLGHGTLLPCSLFPPLAPVRWARYLSRELEPRRRGARPPHGVTAVAAPVPASPCTSSRRPPRPYSPERRAAGRSPAHIQPFGSHLAGAAAARAPLRACGRSVGWSRSGRDR